MKVPFYFFTIFLGIILAVHLSMNGKVGSALANPRVGNALFWCIGGADRSSHRPYGLARGCLERSERRSSTVADCPAPWVPAWFSQLPGCYLRSGLERCSLR